MDKPLNVGDVLRSGYKFSCKIYVTYVCLYLKCRLFDKFHKPPLCQISRRYVQHTVGRKELAILADVQQGYENDRQPKLNESLNFCSTYALCLVFIREHKSSR